MEDMESTKQDRLPMELWKDRMPMAFWIGGFIFLCVLALIISPYL
jgi:hypothetical protein